MKYVEAVEEYQQATTETTLFLAGGITSCPDWQSEAISKLSDTDLTILNPRRANFPINDPTQSEKQIRWEHRNLCMADAILFWFPCETLCPIVLFELGARLQYSKKLFIGCHPEYSRKYDVIIQSKLEKPDIEIVYSLNELVDQVKKWDFNNQR